MTLGKRIAAKRAEKGLSQRALARACGVSQPTISAIESCTKAPSTVTIGLIAAALNTTVSYLMGEESSQQPSHRAASIPKLSNIVPITTHRVPIIGSIHAGIPTYAEEDFEGYVDVGTDIRCDFALRVVGDSMTGARILDGDIVFVRKQPIVENGEIAAVILGDEAALKRVYFYPNGTVVLAAANPAYAPITIQPDAYEGEAPVILGKAIAFQSDVR